jgi:nuclease S1
MFRSAIALLLFSLTVSDAFAWSELGHRLVGELAQRRLTPAAQQEVTALLAGEAEPTLAGVSVWPDKIRDLPEYKHTGPLHYVRINDANCVFNRARDCADGACVVDAIEHYRDVLTDRSRQRAERAEALKFVVHFVGDAHQPLHSGHRPDKGGNEFQINLRGEGTNLHSVWDDHMLASAKRSFAEWIALLETPPAIAAANSPAQWAEGSCRKTNETGFYPRKPGKLSPAYLDANRDYAAQRIREAAAELAAILEPALAGEAAH